jgi:hypothetical protein
MENCKQPGEIDSLFGIKVHEYNTEPIKLSEWNSVSH